MSTITGPLNGNSKLMDFLTRRATAGPYRDPDVAIRFLEGSRRGGVLE